MLQSIFGILVWMILIPIIISIIIFILQFENADTYNKVFHILVRIIKKQKNETFYKKRNTS